MQDETINYFDKFVKQYLVICTKKIIFSYDLSRRDTFLDKFVESGDNCKYSREYYFCMIYDK